MDIFYKDKMKKYKLKYLQLKYQLNGGASGNLTLTQRMSSGNPMMLIDGNLTNEKYFCSLSQSTAASILMNNYISDPNKNSYDVKFYYLRDEDNQIIKKEYSISRHELESKLIKNNQKENLEKNIIYAGNPIYQNIKNNLTSLI